MRLKFAEWLNEDANISSIPQIMANAISLPLTNKVTPVLAKDLQKPIADTVTKALKPVEDQLKFMQAQRNKPQPQVNQPNKPGEALTNNQEIKSAATRAASVNAAKPGDYTQMTKDIIQGVQALLSKQMGAAPKVGRP
jgi:hypothetical protein